MSTAIPDIRFYDFDFNLLHVENHFTSTNWKIYYNDVGTFEAHFDLQSDTLPVIMKNEFVIAVQGDKYAIVVGKKLGDDLAVFGRTCNWLLTKRINDEFEAADKTVYDLVTEKVSQACSVFPVVIGETVNNTSIMSAKRSDKCQTFKLVQELLEAEHLGHSLTPDFTNNNWIFQVIKGNTENRLVISTTNRNAYDVTIDSDLLDLCSEGWYERSMENMGEWEPNSGLLQNNNPLNYGKFWKVSADGTWNSISFKKGDYLICRNVSGTLSKSDNYEPFWVKIQKQPQKSGALCWDTLLSGKNESEAFVSLNNAKQTSNIQGKTANVRYTSEYNLGDIVTVEWQAGNYKIRSRKRIVGVNLWYESGNIGEEAIFEDITE